MTETPKMPETQETPETNAGANPDMRAKITAGKTTGKEHLVGWLATLQGRAAPVVSRASSAAGKYLPTVLGANPNTEKSNPYAPYLSRSILLEEAAPPKNARAVINVVSITLAAFVLLASVATLDERAVADGEILPLNFVQPVQHLEGGIVAAVLVEEGEIVKEG